jgi:hypothetical protein
MIALYNIRKNMISPAIEATRSLINVVGEVMSAWGDEKYEIANTLGAEVESGKMNICDNYFVVVAVAVAVAASVSLPGVEIARFSSIDNKMDIRNIKSVRMNCTNEVILFDRVTDIDFYIEFSNAHTVFFKNCGGNAVYYNTVMSKMPELKTVYSNSKFDYDPNGTRHLDIYQEKSLYRLRTLYPNVHLISDEHFGEKLNEYNVVEPTMVDV